MSYLINQVLSSEEVSRVRNILKGSANWIDGLSTVKNPSKLNRKIKDCYNLSQSCDEYHTACDVVFKGLDNCKSFGEYTVPDESGPILYSKTIKGGYYKPHHDCPSNGEYSNTLFLSNPLEYGGGELSLLINGEVNNFKLKPGMMITYPTGVPHEVKQVTRGSREVAVFWTKSKFKNEILRTAYSDGLRCAKLIDEYKVYSNIEEAHNDPTFILQKLLSNLERLNQTI